MLELEFFHRRSVSLPDKLPAGAIDSHAHAGAGFPAVGGCPALLNCEFMPEEITTMIAANPVRLIGLDED